MRDPQDDPDAMWRRPGSSPVSGASLGRTSRSHEPIVDRLRLHRRRREALATASEPIGRDDHDVAIAIVAVGGVLRDEHEAFRSVFALWPGGRVVTVGHAPGRIGGAGGAVDVDTTFDDLTRVDVVAVPGALGVDAATHDTALCRWLADVAVTARWIVSSSTGSVVLAAAGLLDGRPAATSWLAGDLLARHGSAKTSERIHLDDDRIITCSGSTSALEGAFTVIARELGEAQADELRSALARAAADDPKSRRRSPWRRPTPNA